VAAELAAARPATPLASLVAELTDQQGRLELLEADGDQRTAIRAVFSWSYRQLRPGTARAFRLAGLHPGSGFDLYAGAALADCTLEQARQHLDPLLRAHLIQPATPGGYGMHDLLREYARELCTAENSEADRRAALTRLFDHYLHAAAAAMDLLYPAEQHHRPRIAAPASPVPPLTSPAQARAWLDAQRVGLAEVAAFTAAQGWPGHTIQLATTLWRYLDLGGHYPEAITIHSSAHRAACASGDRAAQAEALINLAVVHWRQGRCQQAASQLRQALTRYQETGDQAGQARALNNLGLVDMQQSRYHQAADHLQQALDRYRETGDQTGTASALVNLGLVERWQGRYQQATDHLGQALTLCHETGDPAGEASALACLGDVHLRQRRYQQATGYLRQALTLCHETGNRNGTAGALTGLGSVDLRLGCYQQAARRLREALALFADTGDRCGEAEALNGLGEVLLAAGQPGQARAQHTAAFDLASQIGDRYEQARAHNGLGHAWLALGDPDQACQHWQQARSRYADLGTPEAGQVQALLTAHSPQPAA
jgi:tetratricopeptide (TPR) repeat protein